MSIQKRKNLLLWLCTAILIISMSLSGFAQVSLSNYNTYTQNFNNLTFSTSQSWFVNNTTLPGWYLQHENYDYPAYPIRGNDGTNTELNFYSYGNSGSSDRALGGMANGINTGSGYIGFRVKNNTGAVIRNFEISYTLEQWYNSGKAAKFDFSYAVKPVGTPITSVIENTANWINVDDMDVVTPSTTSPTGRKNGNDASHRINKKFTLIEINLQPGQEIMLRWQYITLDNTNGNGLALEDVSVTPQINVFYAKSTGDLNKKNTWTRNKNGTGGNPTDFSLQNQIFHITQGSGRELDKSIVLGANSKIVIGDGINEVNVSVKKNSPFIGKIDVLNHGTLILTNSLNPELGKLSDESTVIYAASNETDIQTLKSDVYGNLIIRDFDLTLNKNKILTGGNSDSYIVTNGNGNLGLTVPRSNADVLFPVGNSSYNPVVLKQRTSGAEDVFKVRVLDGLYTEYQDNGMPFGTAQTEKAVNRTWLVDEEVSGGSDVTMKVYYSEEHGLTDFDAESSYLSHYSNGAWDEPVPGVAGTEGSLFAFSREGITSFSPFAIFSSQTLLPVELLYFTASYSNSIVALDWATMSETNNNYFTIESSKDGVSFTLLAEIDGAGSSNKKNFYHFDDNRFLQGQVFYRLLQTDFDGKSTYSPISSVYVPVRNISEPFPNPTVSLLNIPVNFDNGATTTIFVEDMEGNSILTQEVSTVQGNHAVLDISGFVPNIYIIRVEDSANTKTYKVVKI